MKLKLLIILLILTFLLNGSSKEDNIYPLEFFQISNAKTENLKLDNINKII
jgi:hypothetical protein